MIIRRRKINMMEVLNKTFFGSQNMVIKIIPKKTEKICFNQLLAWPNKLLTHIDEQRIGYRELRC